jgi:recombination protein RecA
MSQEDIDKKRTERIAKMCATINNGDFGGENKDAVIVLGSRDSISIERWSSGDKELDWALGGGWPKGRFIELYGPESGGKTTLLLHAIAGHQRIYPDEDVALIDTEFAFDEEYAAALGVQTRWLIVHQPESGEQALNVLRQLIQLGVGCVGVDSVAALTTRAEVDGALGDDQVAAQARLMSKSLKVLTQEAGKRRATVFWTNQIRDLINVSYGDKTTTPAGHALKHYASIRVGIKRISSQKETIEGVEQFVANLVRCDVKKNKTAPPFRKAEFYISYGHGIDPAVSVFDSAVTRKVILQKGSWFSFEGNNLAAGRGKCIVLLQENKELLDRISAALDAKDKKSPVEEGKAEPEEGAESANSVMFGKKGPRKAGSFKKPRGKEEALPAEDDAIEVTPTPVEAVPANEGVAVHDV